MNFAKSYETNDIPTRVIKMNEKIFANFITDHLSYCIACAEFSDELKLFNIITVHQKNESCVKKIKISKHSDPQKPLFPVSYFFHPLIEIVYYYLLLSMLVCTNVYLLSGKKIFCSNISYDNSSSIRFTA